MVGPATATHEQVEVYWFSDSPRVMLLMKHLHKSILGVSAFQTHFDPMGAYCTTSTRSSMPSPMRWASTQ